jgi:hypothetical protein
MGNQANPKLEPFLHSCRVARNKKMQNRNNLRNGDSLDKSAAEPWQYVSLKGSITTPSRSYSSTYTYLTGSITAGALLGEMVWRSEWAYLEGQRNGWFFEQRNAWFFELAINRYQLDRWREVFKKRGWLEESYLDFSHKLFYRINFVRLQSDLRIAERAVEMLKRVNAETRGKIPDKAIVEFNRMVFDHVSAEVNTSLSLAIGSPSAEVNTIGAPSAYPIGSPSAGHDRLKVRPSTTSVSSADTKQQQHHAREERTRELNNQELVASANVAVTSNKGSSQEGCSRTSGQNNVKGNSSGRKKGIEDQSGANAPGQEQSNVYVSGPMDPQNRVAPPSRRVKPREAGTNARALGTNPRAAGTNPRAASEPLSLEAALGLAAEIDAPEDWMRENFAKYEAKGWLESDGQPIKHRQAWLKKHWAFERANPKSIYEPPSERQARLEREAAEQAKHERRAKAAAEEKKKAELDRAARQRNKHEQHEGAYEDCPICGLFEKVHQGRPLLDPWIEEAEVSLAREVLTLSFAESRAVAFESLRRPSNLELLTQLALSLAVKSRRS